MAGTHVMSAERNLLMTSIDNARAKWGLNKVNSNVNSGTLASSSDYNNLVSWLTEAKNKSGSTTTIEGNISAGTVMTHNKVNNLMSQANAVYTYCRCHGNCRDSCTGSCSGSCTGRCSGSCGRSCGSSGRSDSNDSGH